MNDVVRPFCVLSSQVVKDADFLFGLPMESLLVTNEFQSNVSKPIL